MDAIRAKGLYPGAKAAYKLSCLDFSDPKKKGGQPASASVPQSWHGQH